MTSPASIEKMVRAWWINADSDDMDSALADLTRRIVELVEAQVKPASDLAQRYVEDGRPVMASWLALPAIVAGVADVMRPFLFARTAPAAPCKYTGYPYPCPYTREQHGEGLPGGHPFTAAPGEGEEP